ncbi:MAG TPA: hypothetical protein VEB63_01875 [Chitinophagaceae bacterium]|nr:hypothetical protein [Chitinophagaceae bacterium]
MKSAGLPLGILLFFSQYGNPTVASAQTVSSEKGLTVVTFSAEQGKIYLRVPSDLTKGETISGSVFIEPSGNNARQLEKNRAELGRYTISLSGRHFPLSRATPVEWIVDTIANAQLLDSKGAVVAHVGIPVSASMAPLSFSGCRIPSHGITGFPFRIRGSFNGRAADTECLLGNQPIEVIAESQRQCIVQFPEGAKGPRQIQIRDSESTMCRRSVSGVDLQVTAGRLDLRRGETTHVRVSVTGLQLLPDAALLTIDNLTPQVVNLEGGNIQTITLWPLPDSAEGRFEKTYRVMSTTTGSFTVKVNLDLPDLFENTNSTVQEDIPPGYTKKSCDCSGSISIQKTGNNSFRADATGACNGACGIGIHTFTRCEVQSVSYRWSVVSANKNARIDGRNDGRSVNLAGASGSGYSVCVVATIACIDGTSCEITACADEKGSAVKPPGTEVRPPTEPTREKVKCECDCKVDGKLVKVGMNGGRIVFKVDAKGECKNKPCSETGTRVTCTLVKLTYAWSVGAGKEVVEIAGAADKAEVSLKPKGVGNYSLNVKVTATCSDGTTCSTVLNAEEVIDDPPPTINACSIVPQEKVEPAMNGRLKSKYIVAGKQIRRDQFIDLGAEGLDYDQLKWSCEPLRPCPDSRSEKVVILNSRVRFEWKIEGEGSFVRMGCLPDEQKTDAGDNVIFKPPVIPLPQKAADTTVTTKITLVIKDDNPTQPQDADVERVITVITKRSKSRPDFYSIDIKAEQPKLPDSKVPPPVVGSCETIGPVWQALTPVTPDPPVIQFPDVPDNDKMLVGQWMVVSTADQRDVDKVILNCKSKANCPTTPWSRDYEDQLTWTWTVKGGGKILSDPTAQFVVYEAPVAIPAGKDFLEIEFIVRVKNVGGKAADKETGIGKKTIRVYRAGVELSHPSLSWLPSDDNNIQLTSSLRYRDGKWKPAPAHACRIHYFELMSVSQERGTCLNEPMLDVKRPDACYDLVLPSGADHETFDERKVEAKEKVRYCDKKDLFFQARTVKPEREYTITVNSFDFGSYGFLRSFANVNRGGRDSIKADISDKIPIYEPVPAHVAHELRHPQRRPKRVKYTDNRVTIPHDIDENRIADGGWKTLRQKDVADPAENNADDDNLPRGNGRNGDGLSTYEEYRGFKIRAAAGSVHTRTDPERKQLFIYNRDGLDHSLYQEATGLDLVEIRESHYLPDEFGENGRVVNFNSNGTTNVANQKALRLVDGGRHTRLLGIACPTNACPDGPPGPPNWMYEIRVYTDAVRTVAANRNLDYSAKLRQVIAHELAHGVNICHHGEGDPSLENAYDAVHGLRSGDTTCIMRYDNIGTNILRGRAEVIGRRLCESSAGTGFNRPGNRPGFDNAQAGRGNCISQIHVSGEGRRPDPCHH